MVLFWARLCLRCFLCDSIESSWMAISIHRTTTLACEYKSSSSTSRYLHDSRGAEAIADVDKAVAKFFVECVAAGKTLCPLVVDGESAKQLQDRFDRYLNSLYASDKNAWFEAKSAMFTALRGPAGWPEYATMLASNYTQYAITKRQSSAPFDPSTAAAAADSQPNSLSAVTCGDWQLSPSATVDDFKSWLALYNKTSTYAGDSSLITILFQCARWSVRAKERYAGPYTGVTTRKPILFVQTMYDPVTPLVSAQNSSSGFLGSGILRSSGTGVCPLLPFSKVDSNMFLALLQCSLIQTSQSADWQVLCQWYNSRHQQGLRSRSSGLPSQEPSQDW